MNVYSILTDGLKHSKNWPGKEKALELAGEIIQEIGLDRSDLYRRPSEFSGGQRQHISIARALMKNAPILMLDDSVSAVDTETEKTILKNLRETRRGKTTVIIAHRISTVENLDRIMFLKEGRIEAYGTHSELIATCPEYARLVELQKLEDKEVA